MLPTPVVWLKKVLVILKSNLSPNQIAFAFALGIFAGLPPMGLHVLIPSTLALLFRCSFRAFLISMGLFRMLSLAIAPSAYALGIWLLDTQRGLDRIWRWIVHLPVIAPMGYARYILMGSLSMSVLLAIPNFFLIRLLVRRYRDSFSAWVASWSISRWLKGKLGAGWIRKVLVGGEAKYAVKPLPTGPFRFIRRGMLIGLPFVYATAYLIATLVIPFFAETMATSTASLMMGSEVAVTDSSFNLLTGGLVLTDFALRDPKVPDENLISIPKLVLNMGMLPMLSNRVVFNSVVIADAELHVKREADGTLNVDNASAGWDASGYLEWAADYANQVDWLGLMRHLLEYLGEWDPLAFREDAYAAYGGGRIFSDYEPPFAIEQLEIGRILISLSDEAAQETDAGLPPMTLFEVEVSNLAFPSSLRTGPILLSLRGQWGDDPDSGFEGTATFVESENGLASSYEFSMKRIDLPRLVRLYATTLPVRILSGLASLSGSILLEGDSATGTISFLLEEFELDSNPDQVLFGLPVGTSSQVIEGINLYAAELPIVFGAALGGTADVPQLEWEAALLEIAREGLMMAGRREFNQTIEDLGFRIDLLGGIEGVVLDPSFEAVQQRTGAAATSIMEEATGSILQVGPLTGDRIGDEPEETPGDEAQPAVLDLLPGLVEKLLDTVPVSEKTDDEAGKSE